MMPGLIPWDRPRGAIHDVEYLNSLSSDRTVSLCVSERTFYLLLNLAAQDAGYLARYAVEKCEAGYVPCTREHELFPLVADAYNNLQVELEDMSCDIVAALDGIRDAIAALTVSVNVGGQTLCCYEVEPGAYHDAEPGEGAPEDLCLLAYAYALAWEQGANDMYHQWATGSFPALGVLSAIFDDFDLPAQVLLEIVTLGATHAVPLLESIWRIATANLTWDITCAIYNAPGAIEAQAAIYAVIDDTEGLEGIAADLMKAPITYSGLNKVYDGTFPTEGVETPDCEDCGEPIAGDLFLTRQYEPYNHLIVGDSIEAEGEWENNGYLGKEGYQEVYLYFTPTGNATTWEWQAEVGSPDYPGTTQHAVGNLAVWSDGLWVQVKEFAPIEFDCDEWTVIYRLVDDTPLQADTPYRLRMSISEFPLYYFYRAIAGATVS